jgi:FMN phosphatase YigB (HAD superfamily)
MTIRGIIFDLGWTLVDFTGDIPTTAVQRARDLERFMRDNGFELDGMAVFTSYREEMDRLRRAGAALNYEYPARLAMLRALRRYVGREDAAHLARGALDASFECLIPLWELYPDTLSTLSALRDAGCRLGCVSNTNDGAHVQRMIDYCGLRPWLSPIYTSEEIGLRKPHPYLFQMVLDGWQLSPPEVVMVGDTLDADASSSRSFLAC